MRFSWIAFLTVLATPIFGCKTSQEGGTSSASEVTSAAPPGCEVVIVGGGVGGLHTAYRLGPTYGAKVCLFEKEGRFGGRIYDIAKSPDQVNGPFIAVGGRRVMDGQVVLLQLAKELGITLQKPEMVNELTHARGMYAVNKDDMIKAYPNLPVNRAAGNYEGQLNDLLLKGPKRAIIDRYPTFKSYVLDVVGPEGYAFLHETYRFRADYEYQLSAKAYLEYLDEENNAGAICPSGNCQTLYPVGGMSAYVRGLAAKAARFGVRMFLSEPVVRIDRAGPGFRLQTAKQSLTTPHVIIAVPPVALAKIDGDIPVAIRAQSQFQALVGVRVTTIAQWYDQPWWRGIVAKNGKAVWRAWTTESCINSVEIPQEPYAAAQNVIRSVYNDQLDCVRKWEQLSKDPPAMEREIATGLNRLFANNGVTKPVTIPRSTKTVYHEWADAWYFIRAGSPYSNMDIYRWAVEPLPGEAVGLVSEGYNPQRSAWTDGAFKSSIHYLNRKFGMHLTGAPE